MKEIIWSHSKLQTILTCPMTYNVIYNHKVSPKFEKESLSLGSAVHWGIEHSIDVLDEYYGEKTKFKKDEKILAESMVNGYLIHKEELFKELLNDDEILEENHELEIIGKLKSNLINEHKFKGIIDCLLLTNKGFIVIDYKTSSSIPEWNNYLDQLYRYIFLLKCKFPDIPVYKFAIINLRKCKVKRKINENDNSFRKRLDVVYQLNDEKHIDIHIYKSSELNVKDINIYINNLSKQCDAALSIINSKSYYINYKALDDYGGSLFKELLLNNEGAYTLYNIKDVCINELTNQIEYTRDMYDVDVENILFNTLVLNSYEDFKIELLNLEKELNINLENFKIDEISNLIIEYLQMCYDKINIDLVKKYINTFYILEFPSFKK